MAAAPASAAAAPPVSPPPDGEQQQGAIPEPGEGRKVSTSDIQLVQNLIERCLQLYMSQREVVTTLHGQAKIEPGFTGLVWQKLEEQNPQFFQAYYTRLKLKDQIVLFNHLLDQQVSIVQRYQWNRMPPQVAGVSGIAQRPGMPPAAGLPGMQPQPSASAAVPAGAPTLSGADGAYSGSGLPGHGPLLDDVQGLCVSAAAASPPLFTGDSGGVGNMAGAPSSDNLLGLPHAYQAMHSPLHGAQYQPGTSGEHGAAATDHIPRIFSMSDLNFADDGLAMGLADPSGNDVLNLDTPLDGLDILEPNDENQPQQRGGP